MNYKPPKSSHSKFKKKDRRRDKTSDNRDDIDTEEDNDGEDRNEVTMSTMKGKKPPECWLCGSKDHLVSDCPERKAFKEFLKKDVTLAHANEDNIEEVEESSDDDEYDGGLGALACIQMSEATVVNSHEDDKVVQLITPTQSRIKMILDSASTVTIIKNAKMVENIRPF